MKRTMNILKLIVILILTMMLHGCYGFAEMTGQKPSRPLCSNRVIERAFMLYGEAKSGLAMFYKEQNEELDLYY